MADYLYALNFTKWKQNYIRAFLTSSTSDKEVLFISSATDAVKKGFQSDSQLVTWASKNQAETKKLVEQFNVTSWQVEDGFIRSAGLGTDLTVPASLVLDKTGIYYDPTAPSDLQEILQNKEFSTDELDRANKLKGLLLENELSKYNLGTKFKKESLNIKNGQKIILVPGQVEGDASIKKGCVDINTNSALIKAARENELDAYLLYKPHPDVVSGNRKGRVTNDVLEKYCDLVLYDSSITDCLEVGDEVHTMTSLVGFEGLLRGLKVVCYGRPFYSGWGLTTDRHTVERRTRKLKLDELVAGTLIDYPRYIDWQSGESTTPEFVIKQIKEQIDRQGGKQSNQVFWLRRIFRKVINFSHGVFSGGK